MKRNKKKKNLIVRARRRCHRTVFLVGAILGAALGFNMRNIVDAVVEKLAALKK